MAGIECRRKGVTRNDQSGDRSCRFLKDLKDITKLKPQTHTHTHKKKIKETLSFTEIGIMLIKHIYFIQSNSHNLPIPHLGIIIILPEN